MAEKLVWNMYAGGIGARQGKHGYDARGEFGEYHIFTGRRGDYQLSFANTKGLPGQPGLWREVGTFRSPQAAKRAAADDLEARYSRYQAGGPVEMRIGIQGDYETHPDPQGAGYALGQHFAAIRLKKTAFVWKDYLGEVGVNVYPYHAMDYVSVFRNTSAGSKPISAAEQASFEAGFDEGFRDS